MKITLTLIIVMLIAGCAHHSVSERITHNDGTESHIKACSWQFLYFTQKRKPYLYTPSGTHFEASELEAMPDANSIKAVTEFGEGIIIKAIKP